MPAMERIFIRIDEETGAALRRWFQSQGTTLAGAIQGFLMEEYAKFEASGMADDVDDGGLAESPSVPEED